MITITTSVICKYLKQKFPDISSFVKNGNIDKRAQKSIGVFMGSDTRSNANLSIGGIDCTAVRMIPINIQIRWTDDQQACDNQAVDIYNELLLERQNFDIDEVKVAFIHLLDGAPAPLGRDDKNICEVVIRANFYYYI